MKKYYDKCDVFNLLKFCQDNHIELPCEINTNDVIIALESELFLRKKINKLFSIRLDYLFLIVDHVALQKNENTIIQSEIDNLRQKNNSMDDVYEKLSNANTRVEIAIMMNELLLNEKTSITQNTFGNIYVNFRKAKI